MSFENISPNMNLPIPGVGQTLGPTWATDLNNSLTLVDQHNHTSGYGVPIPPSGLNINADLTMNNNNLIAIKSLRITAGAILAGASDLDCLFVNGVDLYYNDGIGNHVRITQSGGVAGTPGSISNLTSPASASYVAANETFVWQSDANTPANMDSASLILRNLSANSFGLTLAPPAAMGADFNLTLPSLPASQKIMTLDAAGNMSAPYSVDNVTIEIASNVIREKNTNVTTVAVDTTISSAVSVYLVDTTSSDINMTLPTSVGGSRPIIIKKVSYDSNRVYLLTTGGQTIDGASSGSVSLDAPFDSITLQADGTNYQMVARVLAPVNGQLYKSTTQSFPNDADTQILYNGAIVKNMTSTSSKMRIDYAGYYSITATMRWVQNTAGNRKLQLVKNGSYMTGTTTAGVANIGAFVGTLQNSAISMVLCAPGDLIEGVAYQNSSGALSLDENIVLANTLSVVRIAPASDV